MAELVDILVQLLCQQDTVSKCQDFLNQYPDVTQQLLWLVFFPSIFMIILVIHLQDGILKTDAHKKLKGLLAVAFFLFVVFQGWYYYALILSKYWYISVLLMGAFFVIIHKMGAADGGGGGGGGGHGKADKHYEAVSKSAFEIAKGLTIGSQEIDPIKRKTNQRLCEEKISGLKEQMRSVEKRMEHIDPEKQDRAYAEMMGKLSELEQKLVDIELRKKSGLPPD